MENNLTTEEAVLYLQTLGIDFSVRTLAIWRHLGRGPRFKKVGRRVFYLPSDLDRFAEGKIIETSDSLGQQDGCAQ